MLIENKFEFGDFVYCKTDPQQQRMQITSIIVEPTTIIYECSCNGSSHNFYDLELTTEPDLELKIQ